jgi:N-acetyl-alpha-D-muramate 1-phosphate uridylyltransferase
MTAPTSGPFAAMIFAAGLGTRMGALTRDRPKPLIPVAGRPLLDHALALARGAGVTRIVVNTHAHAGQVADHLARVAPDALVSHEPERLETGGGLRHALPLLGPGPVFTLNADMVWRGRNPLEALADAWRPGMGALLVLVPRDGAVGHAGPGDFFLAADGRLTRRGTAEAAPFVYAGAEIIDTDALAGFEGPVFSLNPVWDRLIDAGRLFGIVHTSGWVDVGRPEGIALAEAELAR